MKEQGFGFKRIANKLNELGIPSPDAGRVRTDGGAKHRVSGLWNHNTIAELCRNPIISGVLQLGTRSEGKHRRFTPNGSRTLNADDRFADNERVKVIINPVDQRIRRQASFSAPISQDRFEDIQSKVDARSACQRGIPRAKDPAKYPLGTCVVDLTGGCGAMMYGVPRKRQVHGVTHVDPHYTCGRYLKTADCNHNSVDGEQLLAVALNSLKHMIRESGTRSELVSKLEQLATQNQPTKSAVNSQRESLVARLNSLTKDRETIGKKLAVESDSDLLRIFRNEFAEKGRLLEGVKSQIAALPAEAGMTVPSSAEVVRRALKLLDNLEVLATCPEARPRINAVLKSLGVWIGLEFTDAQWGKRTVRRVSRGMITFGGYHLPVPLHGRDNSEPKLELHSGGCSTACQSAASVTASNPDDGSGKYAGKTAKVDEKGHSYTKVNRGDRIRTCDLLVPNQSR